MLRYVGEFEALDAVEDVAHLITEGGRIVAGVTFVDRRGARNGAEARKEIVEAVGFEVRVEFVVVAVAENVDGEIKLVEREY